MLGWKVRYAISLVLVTSILAVVPASGHETCPCMNLPCLFALLKQRQALADGYEAMAATQSLRVLDQNGKAVDFINEDTMPKKAFKRAYKQIGDLKNKYETLEKSLFDRVPAASCGGEASVAAKTHPLTCVTTDLEEAQAAVPCPELKDMIAAHEDYHRTQCHLRKHNGKYLPYLWMTPAGLAKEEATAYKQEVKTLRALLDSCCG